MAGMVNVARAHRPGSLEAISPQSGEIQQEAGGTAASTLFDRSIYPALGGI